MVLDPRWPCGSAGQYPGASTRTLGAPAQFAPGDRGHLVEVHIRISGGGRRPV